MFGGQYLWFEAGLSHGNKYNKERNCKKGLLKELISDYPKKERNLIEFWKIRLKEIRNDGLLAIWGAGAKGTTFVNLIDPERRIVDCVIDMNPNKQGKFIAGSAHPIFSIDDLGKRKKLEIEGPG